MGTTPANIEFGASVMALTFGVSKIDMLSPVRLHSPSPKMLQRALHHPSVSRTQAITTKLKKIKKKKKRRRRREEQINKLT
jgi:hypothetical protein